MPPTPAKENAKSGAKRPLPEFADYSDQVTDADHKRIKGLVPEGEYEDAEEVSGPAW